jgi:hypothetical protein
MDSREVERECGPGRKSAGAVVLTLIINLNNSLTIQKRKKTKSSTLSTAGSSKNLMGLARLNERESNYE